MTSHAPAAAWDPAADLLAPVELPAADGSGARTSAFLCRFPGCGRQFQLKGNLKRHQNIHSGDKQFRCDFCGRSFLRKADMEVHLRVHTGEKPYACKHSGCDKRFARRSDLLSHERTHSGSKPFACEFPGCGRRFARRFDLHKHERAHDAADGGDAKKPTMKRRLAVRPCEQCQAADKQTQTRCDEHDDDEDDHDDVKLEGKAAAPPPGAGSAVRTAPISPSDHADGPGKELHFELICTEDHVHISPDCFSVEEWDALLGSSPASRTSCCLEHLQSGGETLANAQTHADASMNQREGGAPTGAVSYFLQPSDMKAIDPSAPFPHFSPPRVHHHHHRHGAASVRPPFLGTAMSPSTLSPTSAVTAQLSASSLGHSSCPIATNAKLHDYAAHTSCGHLAIQHGNHRDFVVKNHLVCLDNVRSLSGDCGGSSGGSGSGGCAKPRQPISPNAVKCAPHDPHRPGCGHLAVRHRDHIDYVVEDNLFCQLAGGLMEDAENIELLDDDFWEFYGAIGSLKTD